MEDSLQQSGKSRLVAVMREAGDVIDIGDVEKILTVSRTQAAKFLSRWTEQGWLRRVGPGVYVPVQLALRNSEQVIEDPWVLVPVLFDPAYIGGWSAAEHWSLTEQIFRDICVYTAQSVRKKSIESHGTLFSLKHINENLIFGMKTVWRSQTRVLISDIHRTMVDMLNDPSTGGGFQHVADCFTQYIRRNDSEPRVLIDYAERLENGAIFKRLGFLAERISHTDLLIDAAKLRLTKGYSKMDPTLNCTKLVTRWRLYVPESWIEKRQ